MSTLQLDEKAVFNTARQIGEAGARESYLQLACRDDAEALQRIGELLRVHEQERSFLESPAGAAYSPTIAERPLTEAPGTVIGPYKLLEQIGEGGFGVVFMAEQTSPVRRKVALKVIKPGMDTRQVIARFEAERQALALMDHPHIAKVFEAGATEAGRPFFVMELVKGLPITEYCDRQHLSPRQRLELFLDVCGAIQHAHQKGIIHRDLKPSNVLVAEYDDHAVPKIIDFGVAKATSGTLTERTMFTQYGQLIGTLAYMSPEQAKLNQLDIDTRSDVYSLGVLLYELLTGTTPFGEQRLRTAAFDEMLRILRDEEPPPPSTRLTTIDNLSFIAANRHTEAARLGNVVRGELDWIVMKCLEKDRARRYGTAADLSRDIQRYLGDEPVEACPPSTAYRFRKFAGRYRGALAIAATAILGVILVVSALIASNIAISRQTAQKEQALRDKNAALIAARASAKDANTKEALAKAAQHEAQENLADARAAVDQMLTRVADRLDAAPQMEHLRQELLEDALKFYEKFLVKNGPDPVLRQEAAWAYRRMALIQRSLGQLVEAEQSYRRYFALFEELEAQSPLEPGTRASLARAHLQFAGLRAELGNREEQEEHLRRAVRIAEDLAQEFPQDQYFRDQLVYANIHLIAQIRRPPDQEEELLRRNLTLTEVPHLVGSIYSLLADVEHREGRYADAERDSLKSFETFESIAAQYEMGSALLQMADVVAADGREEQAEVLYRRAAAIVDKMATDQPGFYHFRDRQAWLHYQHANLLKKLDRAADAEQAYRRAAKLYEQLASDFPAFPAYRQSAFDQHLGLGQFLVEAGRPQDAQQVYGVAVALADKLATDLPMRLKHWQGLIRSHIELGRLLDQSGKTAEAEEAFREAVAISERLESEYGGNPECRREVARSHLDAAWQFRIDVRRAEAEKLYLWALEHFTRLLDASPQSQQAREDLAYARFILADHYRWTPGRLAAAEKLFRDALGQYADLSADFPDVPGYQILTADSRERLASVWQFQGRLQEAEQALKEVLPVAERLAAAHPDDGGVRMILAMATRRWGETVRYTAPPQDVERAFRRSEAMHEKLAADFPRERWHRFEWSVTCQMLVSLLACDLQQPEAADGFYHKAVTVLEGLAAEFPRDLLFRARLADAHREWACCLRDIGRTTEATEILELAVTNYSQAIELGTGDIWGVWYPLALIYLSAGRSDEYHVLCEKLLARFGQADAPDVWVVAICKLAPDAVADLSQPVHIAERLLDLDPDNADLGGVVGEALYRQGDLNAAVERLEASIRAVPGVNVQWQKLFLAMAYHRLGRTVEAQQLLMEATQWMEQNARERLAEGAELEQPLLWCQRVDLQLLHQEAWELLGKKD